MREEGMGEIFSKTCALDYGRPRQPIGQISKPAPRRPRRVFPAGPVMESQGSGTSLPVDCITKTSQRRRAGLEVPAGIIPGLSESTASQLV
jgi:hypothetical protein